MPYTLFDICLSYFLVKCLDIECCSEMEVLTDRNYGFDTELVGDFVGYSFLEFYYVEDLFNEN